jgi:hypothetical protein
MQPEVRESETDNGLGDILHEQDMHAMLLIIGLN